jgi:hypothetical protein
MVDRLNTLRSKASDVDGKNAVVLFGAVSWVWGIGNDTFITDVLSEIGIVNMAGASGWISNLESLQSVNIGTPDIVIYLADETFEAVAPGALRGIIWDGGLPAWPNVGTKGDPAVWAGVNLYLLNDGYGSMLMRAGPRVLDALEMLIETGPV